VTEKARISSRIIDRTNCEIAAMKQIVADSAMAGVAASRRPIGPPVGGVRSPRTNKPAETDSQARVRWIASLVKARTVFEFAQVSDLLLSHAQSFYLHDMRHSVSTKPAASHELRYLRG
jgi:hypothetical protein